MHRISYPGRSIYPILALKLASIQGAMNCALGCLYLIRKDVVRVKTREDSVQVPMREPDGGIQPIRYLWLQGSLRKWSRRAFRG